MRRHKNGGQLNPSDFDSCVSAYFWRDKFKEQKKRESHKVMVFLLKYNVI